MSIQRFVHSSTDRHLGCFYILLVANNAALNSSVLNRLLITGFAIVLGNKFILSFGCSKLCSSPTLIGVVGRGLGSTKPISLPLCPESRIESYLPHVPAAQEGDSESSQQLLGFRTSRWSPQPLPFHLCLCTTRGLFSSFCAGDIRLKP